MSDTALHDLVTGPVIGPDDPGYEDARHVYNFMIEARPHAIVQCASANDVRAVVAHAAATGRDVAVRGGGHSVPGFGTADDAIVVDLSSLTSIEVDPKTQIARVGGGATWAMMNDATMAHGLATTGGIVASTGVAGLTLGGGIGYLTRAHGLSCDNLLSAEVVLADGNIVTASQDEQPDLFWALRGGGGNFGVVTEFTFRLHPVPENIYGGLIFFEREAAGDLFRYFDRFIDDAPREYGGFPAWHLAPPLPFIPADRVGEPFPVLVSCWTGDHDSGAKVLRGFRDVGPVMAEHVGAIPYTALNAVFDPLLPRGLQHYWKAVFVGDLTDDVIAAHAEHGQRIPAVNCAVHLYPVNGAAHDVAPDATAWGHRDAKYATVIAGMWPDPADNDKGIRWVKDYHAALAPHSQPGGYVNFASADDQAKVRDNFGVGYDRLAQVKRRYDPANLFHLNQNIIPA
jgi:FAD binding domain/Berberine and berberine like